MPRFIPLPNSLTSLISLLPFLLLAIAMVVRACAMARQRPPSLVFGRSGAAAACPVPQILGLGRLGGGCRYPLAARPALLLAVRGWYGRPVQTAGAGFVAPRRWPVWRRRRLPAACPAPRLLAHGQPGAVGGDGEGRLHEREGPHIGKERIPTLPDGVHLRAAASPPWGGRGLRHGAHELGIFSPCTAALTARPQGIPRLPQLRVLVWRRPQHGHACFTGHVILHPAALCCHRIRTLCGRRPRRVGGPREPIGFVSLQGAPPFSWLLLCARTSVPALGSPESTNNYASYPYCWML